MHVCIGGTFDHFHRGHEALILKAFEVAGKNGTVFIGITKNNIRTKNGIIESFEKRRKNTRIFVRKKGLSEKVRIAPIYDRFGPSIEEEFEAIIVSPDTYSTADEINRERLKHHKIPLRIIQIPFTLAEDHRPISSSRIRKKEIDRYGNILM